MKGLKYLVHHKNTIAISCALSFFISNLPIWEYDGMSQRIGVMLTVGMIVYAMIWLEGDR